MPSPAVLRTQFTPVRTDRLLLRAPVPDDLDAVWAIEGDPETHRFDPYGPLRSRAAASEMLDRWLNWWWHDGFGFWAVREAADETVIGFGGVTQRTFREQPVLNTYYRFSPSAWGHGYATEMARTAHALGARLLPELPRIVRTRPGNLGAQAVAAKLGLTRLPDLDDQLLTYVSGWE